MFDKIKNIPSNLKNFYQRGKRGYADCDVWTMSLWFERTIISMLEEFKKHKHGYPFGMSSEQWDLELERMIYYFKESRDEFCSEKNEYEEEWCNSLWSDQENQNKEIREKWLQREDAIAKYQENMKNKGLELFSKYYYDLWD